MFFFNIFNILELYFISLDILRFPQLI